MGFFILLNMKIFGKTWATKQLNQTTPLTSTVWRKNTIVTGDYQLPTFFKICSLLFHQKKETHTGLETFKGE